MTHGIISDQLPPRYHLRPACKRIVHICQEIHIEPAVRIDDYITIILLSRCQNMPYAVIKTISLALLLLIDIHLRANLPRIANHLVARIFHNHIGVEQTIIRTIALLLYALKKRQHRPALITRRNNERKAVPLFTCQPLLRKNPPKPANQPRKIQYQKYYCN